LKNKKRIGFTLFDIMIYMLVIGTFLGTFSYIIIIARDQSRKRADAITLGSMPKYLSNLQAHADQFVLANRIFTVWAVDRHSTGWVVHMKDNANYYDDLFVPDRLKEQLNTFYVNGAELSFTRITPESEPTIDDYTVYSVLDYLNPKRLDTK
jgi:hypothetical protein